MYLLRKSKLYSLLLIFSFAAFASFEVQAAEKCTEENQNGCIELSATPVQATTAVPPNIMLMFDDSGSMDWDVMPDWDYLASRSDAALVNQENNGVYYAPDVTYTPPPKAKSGQYDSASFTDAWVSGFNQSGQKVNLKYYNGWDDDSGPGSTSQVPYTIKVWDDGIDHYLAGECPRYTNGKSGTHNGYCYGDRYDRYPDNDYDFYDNGNNWNYVYLCENDEVYTDKSGVGVCVETSGLLVVSGCPSYTQESEKHEDYCFFKPQNGHPYDLLDVYNGTYYIYVCDSQGDEYVTKDRGPNADPANYCIPATSFFTYTIKNEPEGYVRYYVTNDSADCTQAGIDPEKCKSNPDVLENVANWFSYYHTRMLMGKSGLMSALQPLSSNYRFGFGSINGNNDDELPSERYSFNGVRMADVAFYGDGSAGTQKKKFWVWLDTNRSVSSTPLRQALQAVGEYYETSDPWETMEGDPNYSPAGENDKELACRKSYTILTTDGFWNSGNPSDYLAGATDRDGPQYVDPRTAHQFGYKAVPPFSGGLSEDEDGVSLADVAAYYWKNDLRSTSNLVPPSPDDKAFWQHMTTYTVGLGFKPVKYEDGPVMDISTIFEWAHGNPVPDSFTDSFYWPQPDEDDVKNIADMAHAAVVSRGAFFSAGNPNELMKSFSQAIAQIAARNIPPDTGAVNASVATIGALSFNVGYNTSTWTGELRALKLNTDGTTGAIVWDFANKLNNMDYTERDVYTTLYDGVDCLNPSTASPSFEKGVRFAESVVASLDCMQLEGLKTPQLSGPDDTAKNRVKYILGDKSNSHIYRARESLLGAIIRSQPLYVSYPTGNYYNIWPSGSPEAMADDDHEYSDYVADHNDRKGVVYVGANDGMLHAFSAPVPECDYSGTGVPSCVYDSSGGNELWAFIPRAVYPNLGNLTDESFKFRPTVDATPIEQDVFFDEGTQDKWQTVLVGGLGVGGRGIYALNITDPHNFTAADVLWELDADAVARVGCVSNYGGCDVSDLGYTVPQPRIARLSVNGGQWVALVSNGYFPDCTKPDIPTGPPNNEVPSGEATNLAECKKVSADAPSNYSALFIVDVETGDVIAELKTPNDIDGVTSFGLGAPVLGDYDADQVDDVAFAGDLMGNVWRFNLSASSPSEWSVSLVYKGVSGSSGKQGAQPITVMPRLFPDPYSNRFVIIFGTGKYLGAGDNTSDIPTQSVYGVREQAGVVVSKADLLERNVTENAQGKRKLTGPAMRATYSGWFFDLDIPSAEGERVVSRPASLFQSNSAVIATIIPDADNYCIPSVSGALMFVDVGTGLSAGLLPGGHDGIRITDAPTSGTLPMVSAIGGGQRFIPGVTPDLGDDTGGNSDDETEPVTLKGPIWRRRSWKILDMGGS